MIEEAEEVEEGVFGWFTGDKKVHNAMFSYDSIVFQNPCIRSERAFCAYAADNFRGDIRCALTNLNFEVFQNVAHPSVA